MKSTIPVLVTRSLTGQHIEYARVLGLEPVIKPALKFEFPQYWDRVLKAITEHPKAAWVFTSANGVKALQKMMKKGLQVNPDRSVYAVGGSTQKALKKLGVEAQIPYIQDGAHLAEKIIDEGENQVHYFHGNLSRDEMTNKLREAEVAVVETEVYETVIQSVKMPNERVEGILFYSPSAVEGFKRGEGFDQALPQLFAIGNTTADALRAETNQPVEIATKPDTKVMLQMVSKYLINTKTKEPR